MSSKEQFRTALKREKTQLKQLQDQCISLKNEIVLLKRSNETLKFDLQKSQKSQILLISEIQKVKRWYQIFIKFPV